ncbi:hypothetical protein HYS90_02530 [Candidatus Curtissbacteria bacterium]|nr:hypothetical protein [Candidatus Curtissbacteria bacterium]
MSNEKFLRQILSAKPRILTIREKISFGQTLSKIANCKNIDFILVQKPKAQQMTAVLAARIIGKKFVWIQNFANPPAPNFFSRLLISQTDRIMVKKKKDRDALISFGISPSKIKTARK